MSHFTTHSLITSVFYVPLALVMTVFLPVLSQAESGDTQKTLPGVMMLLLLEKPTHTVGNGCTYGTIAEALAAASPGDTLGLEGGRTFTENITIPISLAVRGGYPGCASGNSNRTTLNGNASGSVVIVNRDIAVSLQNLNITNGNTSLEGGGIRLARGDGTGTLGLNNVMTYGNTG